MIEADIKNEILSEFGAPVVRVEIDDSQWNAIFAKAKRWFQSKKGVLAVGLLPASSEIALPDDCLTLVDVILPSGNFGLGALASFGFFPDLVPADIFRMNGNGLTTGMSDISSFVQVLERNNKLLRVLGIDSDYTVSPLGDKIYLNGSCCCDGSGGFVMVTYVKKSWQVDELKGRNEEMFYRYCTALAKRLLGRIRGKYSSYPSAGGSVDMDASVLLEEAKEEIEALDEELALSQYPIVIVKG